MVKREPMSCGSHLTATLRMIGGKWKLLILWHLFQRDSRFGELRRAVPSITQHMLTARLRELEADGIISRTVHAEIPPRVVYALTEHGRSLKTVLRAIALWGSSNLARPGGANRLRKTAVTRAKHPPKKGLPGRNAAELSKD